jgi:hypothetical protein
MEIVNIHEPDPSELWNEQNNHLAETELFRSIGDGREIVSPITTAVISIAPREDTAVIKLYDESVKLRDYAVARIITCNDDLKPVTDDLILIAKLLKAIKEYQTRYQKPIKDHLDAVRAAFEELLAPIIEADKVTREKVKKFNADQDAKIAAAKKLEADALDVARRQAEASGTGEITVNLAPVAQPASVPEHVRTETGTLGGRDNWKARVVDFAKLNDRYKLPNEQLLNALARSTKGKAVEPGVEFYNDRGVAVREK